MNKKYLILGGVLIAISGIGYFLYKKFVTDKVTKMATEVDQQITEAEALAMAQAESMLSPTKPDMVITSSSGSPVVAYTPSGAPLTNAQVLQQYMNR
jgi:hypothetical protein